VPTGGGPIGKVRSTGLSIVLFIVTLGIYGLVWFYMVHDEMQRHRGQGIGGVLALVIAFFVSPAQAFLTSDEVGKLYEARGQERPVTALTGLWYFPGILLCGIGPIVWFVQTNGALNEYWKSLGAQG
jgi:cytochrome bd-type quinol oxidase subunit 2